MSVNSYLVGLYSGWHRMRPVLTTTATTFFIYCMYKTEVQGKKTGSVEVSGKLPAYPSPKPTFSLTSHLGQHVDLGEGYVGSFPKTKIDPKNICQDSLVRSDHINRLEGLLRKKGFFSKVDTEYACSFACQVM